MKNDEIHEKKFLVSPPSKFAKYAEYFFIFIAHIGFLAYILYTLYALGNLTPFKMGIHFALLSLFGALLIIGSAKITNRRYKIECSYESSQNQ